MIIESHSLRTTVSPEFMEEVGSFRREDLEKMALREFVNTIRSFFISLKFKPTEFSQISLQDNLREHPEKIRDVLPYNEKEKIIDEIFREPFTKNNQVTILQPRESLVKIIAEIKAGCLSSDKNHRIGLIFKSSKEDSTQPTVFLEISGYQDTEKGFQETRDKIINSYTQFKWQFYYPE